MPEIGQWKGGRSVGGWIGARCRRRGRRSRRLEELLLLLPIFPQLLAGAFADLLACRIVRGDAVLVELRVQLGLVAEHLLRGYRHSSLDITWLRVTTTTNTTTGTSTRPAITTYSDYHHHHHYH